MPQYMEPQTASPSAPPLDDIVTVRDLTVRFGDFTAVDGISF